MRAFIGIPLPREIGERLEKVGVELERKYGGRRVRVENMHLTLLFLGEVEEEMVERFSFSFQSFPLTVVGLGAFPSLRQARVVWAGVKEGEKVRELAEKVWGLYWREDRFHPHITIGRLREGKSVEELAREYGREVWGSFTVREVVFYRSLLRPGGPIYERVRVVRAGGSE